MFSGSAGEELGGAIVLAFLPFILGFIAVATLGVFALGKLSNTIKSPKNKQQNSVNLLSFSRKIWSVYALFAIGVVLTLHLFDYNRLGILLVVLSVLLSTTYLKKRALRDYVIAFITQASFVCIIMAIFQLLALNSQRKYDIYPAGNEWISLHLGLAYIVCSYVFIIAGNWLANKHAKK